MCTSGSVEIVSIRVEIRVLGYVTQVLGRDLVWLRSHVVDSGQETAQQESNEGYGYENGGADDDERRFREFDSFLAQFHLSPPLFSGFLIVAT